jgi:putative phosphoesterase
VKIAVIADTHLPRGSRRLPEECVRRLGESDVILHAGDFVSLATLRRLEASAQVFGVRGNMDEPAVQALLPERRVVEFEGLRVGMVHIPGTGNGRHARLVSMFPECDAVVYGHTHEPEIARHDGCWILNPGSPTERRRAPTRAMLELRVESSQFVPRLVTFPA